MTVDASFRNVRALFFDVFGTLVDWRTSVAREADGILGSLGYALDWPAFADPTENSAKLSHATQPAIPHRSVYRSR